MTVALPNPTIQLLPDERPPWRVVFGALLLGFVITALGAQAALMAEFARDEVWLASGEVEFRDPDLLPNSVAAAFESHSIWKPIAEREGMSDQQFLDEYTVEIAGRGTQIIRVSFADTDQALAKRVVDGVLESYVRRFGQVPEELSLEIVTAHLRALEVLEADLMNALAEDDAPPQLQIERQNQLTAARQQISTVLLRMDTREAERLGRRNIEPRVLSNAFVLEDPLTPSPARALAFGTATGGLIAIGAIYLSFHRTAQPAASSRTGVSIQSPVGPTVSVPSTITAPSGIIPRSLKRTVDIGISILALLVLSPVMLLIALAVGISTKGPIFYRQERVGRFGQVFVINKFRTMILNNDDSEHRKFVQSLLSDPSAGPVEDGTYKLIDNRVTRVGSVLRRFSLDELPQLWNVLRGEMSLVGPRPLLVWEWNLIGPVHRQRDLARPGCTGLWQVSGRNLVSSLQMLDFDLVYVRRLGFWRDVSILIRTPLTVLRGDGAR